MANAAALYLSGEYDIASLAAFMDKITSEDLAKMKLAGYKKLYDSVVTVTNAAAATATPIIIFLSLFMYASSKAHIFYTAFPCLWFTL